ncbi:MULTISPECIES: low molecular weight protein-tyrosine-phosphatase [unclassified Pseudoalteromonas]|uniref:low molecular weight protein-tyrosine-phosphatase n=1 Tax=unclassified Pseudoalteromonas TaxID=194690 RepID=UPI0020984C24|nr:low molecular weight protein-tyrosine-phosphatase [Pseudoalteromonas sp. XMcav2-N]MCO7188738.1 low molecular weight phosphotyrosine protein phosphatase [Pseudoalteromonas sp. XMcav2-N]
MFENILIVCAGNICRSPTAEYVLRDKVEGKNINVSSAGLTAMEGHKADQNALLIAQTHGIDMSGHKGRQLDSNLIVHNDVILVMEHRHVSDLCSRYPEARGKTFLLGKWLDDKEIPDPYRQSKEAFEYVYELIDSACSAWQKYL